MNNLDAIYDFILKELRKLTIKENFYFKPIKPKLSDLELIAINISAEYLSIDSKFNEMETTFIVDSMPLEICKNARANRSKICKENEFSFPSKGYCASQSSYY
ncbi:IS982 family transposase, partial [Elizabethkingia anophelis]